MKPTFRARKGFLILFPGIVLLWISWGYLAPLRPAAGGNIVANPSFELCQGSLPQAWTFEDREKGKGEVEVVRNHAHSGNWALMLKPNTNNTADVLALNIGQAFRIDPFRGKSLKLSGWVQAEGGALAVIGLYAINEQGGILGNLTLTQDSAAPHMTLKQGTFEVPRDNKGVLLILVCQVQGTMGAAFFDDISVEESAGSPRATALSDQSPRMEETSTLAPATGNILANPGFEEQDGSLPRGWTFEDRVKHKGDVSLDSTNVHSGKFSLRLTPNRDNTEDLLALGVGQGFPIARFRGRTMRVSAWMMAKGAAVAVVGLYAITKQGRILEEVTLTRASDDPGSNLRESALDVPKGDEAFLLVLNCQVAGTSGAAFFDDVSVAEGSLADPESHVRATERTLPLQASVTVDATRTIRQIPRTLYGQNIQWPWGGNMIFDFRTNALSPELIRLTRELNLSLLRFGGGEYYHWRDGVGPQASRRETEIQPGKAKSRHTFGTDEALTFAQETGSQLLLTVNVNNGTPNEAADWVAYVNKKPGGAEPRNVTYWEIGNEQYIKSDISIDPQEYTKRLLQFSKAMKNVDSSIKILAVGGENYGRYNSNGYPNWDREVVSKGAKEVDFLAVHNAYYPGLLQDTLLDVRTVYAAMLAAPLLIKGNLETLSKQIETFAPDQASRIKIAVTEWGPIFSPVPQSRWADHVKTLASALFAASTLKVFVESPRTEIANAFLLNDIGFMGWIGPRDSGHLTLPPRDGQYLPKAPYFALQMYSRHFGSLVVKSSVLSPTYNSLAVGMTERVANVPYLDVVASRSDDGKTLYVMAINKHFDKRVKTAITLKGYRPQGQGTAWTLNGTGIDANTGTQLVRGVPWEPQLQAQPNPRFDLGKPGEVGISSATLNNVADSFEYTFPAHSVTCLEIRGSL